MKVVFVSFHQESIAMRVRHPGRLFAVVRVLLLTLVATFAVPAAAQGRAGLPDFTDLYEKQGPAVVSVDVTQTVRRSQRLPDISEDDPFYEFFKRFGPIPRRSPERDFEAQSTGSGFIVSSDGYIATNAHVVDDASEVTVRLSDRREFKAKVIGADKRSDVALLKIDAKDLPKVTIGDPEKLKVGEWVVAIGKPFGLDNTKTAGMERAQQARIECGEIIMQFDNREIKTTYDVPRIITAVRHGTKVTLIVRRKGAAKDVGVTVAEMKEDTGAPQRRVPPAPKEKAKPNRMGLSLVDLTDEQKKELDVKTGVLVEDISGGVRGNVQAGDIILAIIQRGQATAAKSAAQINDLLAKLDKGASVTLQVRRGDNQFFATLKIGNGESLGSRLG